jgi:hypothetical protein
MFLVLKRDKLGGKAFVACLNKTDLVLFKTMNANFSVKELSHG